MGKGAVFVRIFDPELKAFYTNSRWFAMAAKSFPPVEFRKLLNLKQTAVTEILGLRYRRRQFVPSGES